MRCVAWLSRSALLLFHISILLQIIKKRIQETAFMSTPGQAPQEAISNLLAMDEEYPAPKIVADNALQQDFEREYRRSIEDPQGFWGDIAHRFQWTQKWDHVMEWNGA